MDFYYEFVHNLQANEPDRKSVGILDGVEESQFVCPRVEILQYTKHGLRRSLEVSIGIPFLIR